MVVEGYDYYKVTLKDGISSLNIGDKTIGLYGVRLSDGYVHEFITGRKLVEESDGKNLILEKIEPCDLNELERFDECYKGLSIAEKEKFAYKLGLAFDITNNNYFGIGEMIAKKLIYKK